MFVLFYLYTRVNMNINQIHANYYYFGNTVI